MEWVSAVGYRMFLQIDCGFLALPCAKEFDTTFLLRDSLTVPFAAKNSGVQLFRAAPAFLRLLSART